MAECSRRPRQYLLGSLLGLTAFCGLYGRAHAAETRDEISLESFRAQVSAAQQIVAACAANASRCDGGALPGDETVTRGAASTSFHASWGWLRDALDIAKNAAPDNRSKAMKSADAHLKKEAAEADGEAQPDDAANFPRARKAADAVLARDEFRGAVYGPTWTDRLMARVEDWFLRFFTGVDRLGKRAPWLAPSIEWGSFLLAAGGLVFFVRRSLTRQTLRIALDESTGTAVREGRNAVDWARLAEERGAAADWREAIHCLYWAAILSLETRRAWRSNPTRTPREYLGLLRPRSEAQRALRDLTRVFERVWYGRAEADEAQFRSTQASFRIIESADLRRSGPDEPGGSASMAPAGVA